MRDQIKKLKKMTSMREKKNQESSIESEYISSINMPS